MLSLGSNLGDRMAHLRRGVEALAGVLELTAVSPVVETPAEGLEHERDPRPFLNAAVRGLVRVPPGDLLEACHRIERASGRKRDPGDSAARSRTLDIDIVFFGARLSVGPELILPHPRWKERGFVLRPLREVAPDWPDPVTGRTVDEICRDRRHLLEGARVVGAGTALRPGSR